MSFIPYSTFPHQPPSSLRPSLAHSLAETARLKHAGLDLRKLDDSRRRPSPVCTATALQELTALLQAAEREAEQLTQTWVTVAGAAATIRQAEAAFDAAESSGILAPNPQGEHPGLWVLRFEHCEDADTRALILQSFFAEGESAFLHPTAAMAGLGLRLERIYCVRESLLLVVRPTPLSPEDPATLAFTSGERVFLSTRPPRGATLRRATALRRLLQHWESLHLPLLNLFNPDAQSWGEAQALNIGEEVAAWSVLTAAETAGRQFIRKAIGSADFALLDVPANADRLRVTTELVLQALRRNHRLLLCAPTAREVDELLRAVMQHAEGRHLAAPLCFVAPGETVAAELARFTYANQVDQLQKVGPVKLPRPEAMRVALTAANLVGGSVEALGAHPALATTSLTTNAIGFDHAIILSAEGLSFADFLGPAVHAAKWTLLGDSARRPSTVDLTTFARRVASAAQRAQLFTELQAELAYKACVGKDGSADDEDGELADAYGRRKVLLLVESADEETKTLAAAAHYLRQRQLTVTTLASSAATNLTWGQPGPEVNVLIATRRCAEQTDLLARVATDFRLVVTDASSDLCAPLAVRIKGPKTRGRAAKPRPVILLSWSRRVAESLRGIYAERQADDDATEHVRSLLLDLRAIFPFEKTLWEPLTLLTLKEQALTSVFSVLLQGARKQTSAGRSTLVYHSGLPTPHSLSSRMESLR